MAKTSKPKKTGRKVGRPTIYTQKLADRICALLSEGYSLRTVCARDEMPSATTIFEWIRTYKEFAKQYARAKEESADAMAEEIHDLSDDTLKLVMKGKASKVNAIVQAMKLRVDTRKWAMSKQKPRKYGDRLNVDPGDKSVVFVVPGAIQKKHGIKTKQPAA